MRRSPPGWSSSRSTSCPSWTSRSTARFVVIASREKAVARLSPPVPLELLAFGLESTLRRLRHAVLRGGPLSPDGGVIADWTGAVDEPRELAGRLDADPGVVAHGLFPPSLVTDLVVASGRQVAHTQHARA